MVSPLIGRRVGYVLGGASPNAGAIRQAVIVDVHDATCGCVVRSESVRVDLTVELRLGDHVDPTEHRETTPVVLIPFDPTKHKRRSWHWLDT